MTPASHVSPKSNPQWRLLKTAQQNTEKRQQNKVKIAL
jgi:hypothetical protein